MRYRGTISQWKDDQGYGFITPEAAGSGGDVFVHINSFRNRKRRPVGSEAVTYELEADTTGRLRAVKVDFVGDRLRIGYWLVRISPSISFALLFLLATSVLIALDYLPIWLLPAYPIMSLIAFGVYAYDKSAAKNERWRTKEITLHLLALLGGWPGALLAQKLLRHKSRKLSFLIVFWSIVAVHFLAWAWLLTAEQ